VYLSLQHKKKLKDGFNTVVCVGVGSVQRLNESPLAKHDKIKTGE
jgi:hypothetical protein